jgi:predicted  nucleic acid-binding Zn-ribbon protein
MIFFKRELAPVERFEKALKDKQAARQALADRLNAAENIFAEKRAVAERLAMAGASSARLGRAEADMRAIEDRAKTLRAALMEFDEQIVTTERALAEAKAQRDRQLAADAIEAIAAAIERATPAFDAASAALADAATKTAASVPEATRFATSVDAMRREVLAAAELICWELRSAGVRTRAGNVNVSHSALSEPEQRSAQEIERQSIYTLSPLLWREGGEVRQVPAFVLVGLPKALLPVALRHQHVDYLNARRVQTLMQVHGSERRDGDFPAEGVQFVDLDALAEADQGAQSDVA